jgi:WD40 repeat protein
MREITFFDEANLQITRSDLSIKVWEALTGKPRKELKNQTIGPLWLAFAPAANRFVTINLDREAVTVWDATTLEQVVTLKRAKADRRIAAGLSGDGRTVVTFAFGADEGVELWDVASGRSFAFLRPPSPVVIDVFTDGGKGLNKARLLPSKGEHQGPLWDLIRSLSPPGPERPK